MKSEEEIREREQEIVRILKEEDLPGHRKDTYLSILAALRWVLGEFEEGAQEK